MNLIHSRNISASKSNNYYGDISRTIRSYNVATRKVASITIVEEDNSPELLARIKEYEEQKKNGTLKTTPWEEVKKELGL